MIMRALDSGAAGVIVPMINTPKEAAAAVAACKFPPAGERSWGPMWGDMRKDAAPLPNIANDHVACILMIETQDGVDRLDEIRSEEHTSELQSRGHLVCRLPLEK